MDRARQTIECRGRRVQKKLFKFHFGHEKRSHPIIPPSSLGPNSPRSKGDSSSKVSPDPLVMLCVSPLLSSHAPICPCRRAPRCPQSLRSLFQMKFSVNPHLNVFQLPSTRQSGAHRSPAASGYIRGYIRGFPRKQWLVSRVSLGASSAFTSMDA